MRGGGEEKEQQEVPDEKPQAAGRRTRHRDHQDGAISKGGEVMKVNGLKQRKISLFPARAMFRSGLPGMYSARCWTPLMQIRVSVSKRSALLVCINSAL